jgi:acetolactate synthase II small subunit
MNARIAIDFAVAEGAVVRLVGLIERRGFIVEALDMREDPAGVRASMNVELRARDAGRSFDVLDLQLRRIHGVSQVSVFTPAAEAAS